LLLELDFLPDDVGHVRWIAYGIHEQVDIVLPILEIIIWLEVVEAFHEFFEVLIE
jgi:hypothetical protein